MNKRIATVTRKTKETDVAISLNIDGTGHADIATGVPMLDHMLSHVAVHGLIDLEIRATGDLQIDAHHTIEDVAIVLGDALDRALGDKRGIARMGHAYVPMDESLAFVAIDLSGRAYVVIDAEFSAPMIGTMPASLVAHFLETLATHAKMNLHARWRWQSQSMRDAWAWHPQKEQFDGGRMTDELLFRLPSAVFRRGLK